MKRKVYLDGELADRFGSELFVKADSFKDLLRLLQANDPTFSEFLREAHENNLGFFCKWGDKELSDEKELLLNVGEGDMYISVVPAGSGDGFGKIFAAIVLAVIVFINPLSAPAWLVKVGYYTAATLALTGIAEIMAPDPAVDSDDITTDTSYLFQGSGQTILEGDPVPVLYGRLRVPGKPIDFHLRNANSNYFDSTGFGLGFSLNDINNTTATPNYNLIQPTNTSGDVSPTTPGQSISINVVDEQDPADVIGLGYTQSGITST